MEANFHSASVLATGIKERLRSRAVVGSTAAGVLRRRLEEAWERSSALKEQLVQRDSALHQASERERHLEQQLRAAKAQTEKLRKARQQGRQSIEQRERERAAHWGVERQHLETKVALLESSFLSSSQLGGSADQSRLEESSFLLPADVEDYRAQVEALRKTLDDYRRTRDQEVAVLKAQLEEKTSLMECASCSGRGLVLCWKEREIDREIKIETGRQTDI